MPAASGAGGGNARDVRAGGAYYELDARDKLSATLDRVQKKIKQTADAVKKHTLSGGPFSQFLELAGRGGALGVGIGLAQRAIGVIADDIKDWAFGTSKFKAGLDASVASADKLANRVAEIAANARAAASAFTTRTDKATALSGGIREAQRALDEQLALRAQAVKQHGKLFSGGGQDLRNIGVALVGGLGDERAAAAKAISDIDARIATARSALASLSRERGGLVDPSRDIRGLREAMDLATGPKFSGFVARVQELRRQLGDRASAPLFEQLLGEAGRTDAIVRVQDATAALKAHVESVRQARLEYGKTADEIALMRAQMAGVSREAIDDARRELFSGGNVAQLLGMVLPVMADLSQRKLGGLFDSVKGEFFAPLARQQFGIGNKPNDPAKLLEKLLNGEGRLPERIGESLLNNMRME